MHGGDPYRPSWVGVGAGECGESGEGGVGYQHTLAEET